MDLTLSAEAAARLASAPPVDPAAYEAYLNGMYHWYRLTPQDLELAERYFERALEIDPGYALAYKGIADVWSGRQQFGIVSPDEAGPQIRSAADRALQTDSSIAEVYYTLGVQRTWTDWDWEGAEAAFRRALDLNPSSAEAQAFYSHLLVFLARNEEAIEQADLAVTADPLNPLIGALTCVTLSFVDRYDDAIARCDEALRVDPTNAVAFDGKRTALLLARRLDAFLATEIVRTRALGDEERAEALARGYAEGGYDRAVKDVAELLEARSQETYVPPTWIGEMFAEAGDTRAALDGLERGEQIRDPGMPYMVSGKWRVEIQTHPRFQGMVRRMGLPARE
jgi:tetratricopeptide (TPR) repeat protein